MTILMALALLAQSPPPVAYGLAAAPPVAFAVEDCPCPHCPPGCNSRCWDTTEPRYPILCCLDCIEPAPKPPDLRPPPPAPPKSLPPPPVVTHWSRTDSRGIRWTNVDRASLDTHVDALERSYAAPVFSPANAPVYGSACVGGACGVPQAMPRRGWFGRR